MLQIRPDMFCCPTCFSNSFLKKRISIISDKKGLCFFCNEKNVEIINPEKLFDYFQPLIDLYENDENGHSVDVLIKQDWDVIALEDPTAQLKLLGLIIKNKNLSKLRFKPGLIHDKTSIEQWENFRGELKHRNRFFPRKAPNKDNLEQLLNYSGFSPVIGISRFYRARINRDNKPIPIEKMRKPPFKKTSNGRANPNGIPYLYLASNIETAISEIRGHKGEVVTVAEFQTKSGIEFDLADLRDPRKTISPFELTEGEDLQLIYKYMPYLTMLGKELSKPIIPREANLEYLPSQYLCELIKTMHFHGIVYKSSIANGDNYVIFADNKLKAVRTEQYKITETFIKSKKVE